MSDRLSTRSPDRFAPLQAVSLFSNCGAGDVGYRDAGFSFLVLADADARRLSVAQRNHAHAVAVHGDLRETWPHVVERYRAVAGSEPPALLVACPPCQGMSSARGTRGRHADPEAGSADARNLLALVIVHVARALRPRVVVVENVPAFLTRLVHVPNRVLPGTVPLTEPAAEVVSPARLLVDALAPEYAAFPLSCDLADYGVPQRRHRAMLTLMRRDEPALGDLQAEARSPYPPPSHAFGAHGSAHVTVAEALGVASLPPLDASTRERATDPNGHPLHRVPVWAAEQYAMVAAIPPGSGRSAWDSDRCPRCAIGDVPPEHATCPACGTRLLRPATYDGQGNLRLVRAFRRTTYRRLASDRPAATVTTASGCVAGHTTLHPFEHRVLSPRECALLQTIPEDFDWGDAMSIWGHTVVRQMIGEAVPPRFTRQHGATLVRLLQRCDVGSGTAGCLRIDDPRVARAAAAISRSRPLHARPGSDDGPRTPSDGG